MKFALNGIKPDKEKENKAISEINKYYKKTIDSAGIGAFTIKCDNILMWSHYADNHKGICLEFDFNKDPLFCQDPFWKVNYRNKYPKKIYLVLIQTGN